MSAAAEPKCPTCGRNPAPAPGRDCGSCAHAWERARQAPGFLPTVPLALDFAPAPELNPEPLRPGPFVRGSQLDAFDLDLFTT